MELVKQKTIAGRTFYYTTDEELRQKVSRELDRIHARLEANERELEDLTERKETLGLFCEAMTAFPWLGEALTVYYQRKEALELERRYLTLREAAVRLGVKPSTMYHWVSMRKIPFIKLNSKAVRFNAQALDQWADGGTMPSAKEVQKHGTLQARKDLVA